MTSYGAELSRRCRAMPILTAMSAAAIRGLAVRSRNAADSARQEPDDVFEDDLPPQPRAPRRAGRAPANIIRLIARVEGGYPDERRRSGGPWLVLLALIAAIAVVFGGVWYYNTKIKPTASTATTSETVPVVTGARRSRRKPLPTSRLMALATVRPRRDEEADL